MICIMLAFSFVIQILNELPKDCGIGRQLVDQYMTVLTDDSVCTLQFVPIGYRMKFHEI